jgi:hypothetical protein
MRKELLMVALLMIQTWAETTSTTLASDAGTEPEFEGYLTVHEKQHKSSNASTYLQLKEDTASMLYNLNSTITKKLPTLKEFRNGWYFNT